MLGGPYQGSGGHIGFWQITPNATGRQPGTARDPHLETIWSPNHQKPGGFFKGDGSCSSTFERCRKLVYAPVTSFCVFKKYLKKLGHSKYFKRVNPKMIKNRVNF